MELTTTPPGLTLFPGAGGLPQWTKDITGAQVLAVCRRAEEAGIDNILVPWHVVVSSGDWEEHMGPRWPNPLVAAGAIAGATERVNVIPLAVVGCLEPIDLAKGWATLQWLSDGRCIPVVLAGYIKWEFDLLGGDFDERDQVTDDYALGIKALWRGERSYHSAHMAFEDVAFDPRPPSGSMPMWFGGGSLRSLRRVAAHGDGWLSSVMPHAELPDKIEYICSQPEWQARDVPLKVSAHFVEPTYTRYSHKMTKPPEFGIGAQWVIERAEKLASLGVDVGTAPLAACPIVGPKGKGQNMAADSFDDHLRRIDWFGEEVVPTAHKVTTSINGSRRRAAGDGS